MLLWCPVIYLPPELLLLLTYFQSTFFQLIHYPRRFPNNSVYLLLLNRLSLDIIFKSLSVHDSSRVYAVLIPHSYSTYYWKPHYIFLITGDGSPHLIAHSPFLTSFSFPFSAILLPFLQCWASLLLTHSLSAMKYWNKPTNMVYNTEPFQISPFHTKFLPYCKYTLSLSVTAVSRFCPLAIFSVLTGSVLLTTVSSICSQDSYTTILLKSRGNSYRISTRSQIHSLFVLSRLLKKSYRLQTRLSCSLAPTPTTCYTV